MVVASKEHQDIGANVQFVISDNSSDVTGVEIAGALKNVLVIAAGIVEGMNLGCSEIRWLATKMGAKPTRVTGLSGTGDIMLTCFVNPSKTNISTCIYLIYFYRMRFFNLHFIS
ncbi:hypothetical protein PHAVU_008G185500 [Phaseolus vulgaris]|uniref:Glycerol-3-phosphate dehydrogenase NAD-dependent C-terminal domain-containing protein n=1 Tax=Phaseolus vulgaris TaxID=3885 RepID=V7B683_PHAVU|nr:hypothetical protein PHAVU_008G185500g [Phaseolus vulgaris]ESW13309.1 hypothetical protein PHAVU_008G185500g [Phaseolus vulgaris]